MQQITTLNLKSMDTKNIDKSDFYDVPEAAKLLNISEFTVRKLCRTNKLKAFKKLKKWYIFKSDIVEFIKSK